MNKKMRKAIKAIETQQAAERAAAAKAEADRKVAEAAAKAQAELEQKAREEAAVIETIKARGMRKQLEAIAAAPTVTVTIGEFTAEAKVAPAPINRYGKAMWDACARSRRIAWLAADRALTEDLLVQNERWLAEQEEATRHLQPFATSGAATTTLGQKFLPKIEGVGANGRRNGRFVPRPIAMIARALGNTGFLEDQNRAAAE